MSTREHLTNHSHPIIDPTGNRAPGTFVVFLSGCAAGSFCCLLAESLTWQHAGSAVDHDVLLAGRIGLFYTPVVGLWVGWIQQSMKRALYGIAVGAAIGIVY